MLFKVTFLLVLFSLISVAEKTAEKDEPKTSHSDEVSSGSGEKDMPKQKPPQPKWHIPKVVDHSKGVYMHDHPDFPQMEGGPGGPYRTHYLHARFGIGHRKKRSVRLEDAMLKMFNVRLRKAEDRL